MSSTYRSWASIWNGQSTRFTALMYLVEKSEPMVTVGTAIAEAGSTAASFVRNAPAIMLAISPMASGISPLTASLGIPSMAPAIARAAANELWKATIPQR